MQLLLFAVVIFALVLIPLMRSIWSGSQADNGAAAEGSRSSRLGLFLLQPAAGRQNAVAVSPNKVWLHSIPHCFRTVQSPQAYQYLVMALGCTGDFDQMCCVPRSIAITAYRDHVLMPLSLSVPNDNLFVESEIDAASRRGRREENWRC